MNQEPAQRKEKLFGFIYYQRGSSGRWHLKFRWGRITALFLALIFAGWLTCGFALYLFFKYQRQYDEVSYAKMLVLPFRFDKHRVEMGNYHIERAKELLEEEDFGTALIFLRSGVSRAPGNIEGRLLLAEFFLSGYRQPELAIQLLKQGTDYGYTDVEFTRSLVRLMLRQHEDIDLIAIADEYLEKLDSDQQTAQIFAIGAASAAYYRGMYDLADSYIADYNLLNSPEGIILSSKILGERGQADAAIVLLENNTNRFAQRELLYMELIRTYRESSNYDKARRYAILHNLNNPLNPGPRIELLHAYDYSGQTDRLNNAINEYFDQFGTEERSLALLAEFGAKTGNADLNRDIYNLAIENNFDLSLFSFLVIEAENTAGNYERALDLIAQIVEEKPIWLDEKSPILSALRAVAFFGADRESQDSIYLREILQNPNVRNQTLLALSKALKDMGQLEPARSILSAAYEQLPENQGALTALMRLDIELGRIDDLNDKLVNLLSMRRPPYDLLELAYERLGSDKFMFSPNRTLVVQQLENILRQRARDNDA